jgi:hypothetical protein
MKHGLVNLSGAADVAEWKKALANVHKCALLGGVTVTLAELQTAFPFKTPVRSAAGISRADRETGERFVTRVLKEFFPKLDGIVAGKADPNKFDYDENSEEALVRKKIISALVALPNGAIAACIARLCRKECAQREQVLGAVLLFLLMGHDEDENPMRPLDVLERIPQEERKEGVGGAMALGGERTLAKIICAAGDRGADLFLKLQAALPPYSVVRVLGFIGEKNSALEDRMLNGLLSEVREDVIKWSNLGDGSAEAICERFKELVLAANALADALKADAGALKFFYGKMLRTRMKHISEALLKVPAQTVAKILASARDGSKRVFSDLFGAIVGDARALAILSALPSSARADYVCRCFFLGHTSDPTYANMDELFLSLPVEIGIIIFDALIGNGRDAEGKALFRCFQKIYAAKAQKIIAGVSSSTAAKLND